MQFEKVINGILKYINREILEKMNPWQEIVGRVVVGRFAENASALKQNLMQNGIVKTLCIIDADGNVDVDGLISSIRKEVEKKGAVEIDIPLVGKIKIIPSDLDVLRNDIWGG
jgi:hypothetical protein